MEALRDAEAFFTGPRARLLPFLNADMGMRQGDARSIRGRAGARRQACQKIASQIALRDKTRHDIMRYRQALPSGAVSQQVLQNAMDQLASLDAELHQSRADFQVIRGAARRSDPKGSHQLKRSRPHRYMKSAVWIIRSK